MKASICKIDTRDMSGINMQYAWYEFNTFVPVLLLKVLEWNREEICDANVNFMFLHESQEFSLKYYSLNPAKFTCLNWFPHISHLWKAKGK